MRPLELVLLVIVVLVLATRWLRPRNRQATSSALAMTGIVAALHLGVDGPRWQMFPAYALGIAVAIILGADLRRIGGGKAGVSAKWQAYPSPVRRAAAGMALLVAAVLGAVLPGWLLPRVSFARIAGPYPVARADVAWTDTSRAEALTADNADRRTLLVSIWYPAEGAGGRALRYHPNAGTLAADIAATSPYPSLVFSNLARAHTNSRADRRFNIREGRSPLLLFSHAPGGTRMQSTFLFEQLAGSGYIVASVEHAYAAKGTVLPGNVHAADQSGESFASDAARREAMTTWVADSRFVLDRLLGPARHDASDSLLNHVNPDRIGVIGHMFGGAAAAVAIASDDRIKAGVDFDGMPPVGTLQDGVSRPFLLFTSGTPDDTLVAALLKRGGTEVRLEGAARESFSDITLWSPPLARRLGVAGTDPPAAVHQAIVALTLRFFDQYLKDRTKQQTVELPKQARVRLIPHAPR